MPSDTSRSHSAVLRGYFDKEAGRYDSIYDDDKPLASRIIDSLFRRVILKRFSLIVNECRRTPAATILDVGCGSGRYALELAGPGTHVVGVDLSENMLSLARERARERGIENCRFIRGDFMGMEFKGMFDVGLSIGVLDYIVHPLPFLQKFLRLVRRTAMISFPKRWSIRAVPRKIRLMLKGCPLRLYSSGEVKNLFNGTGCDGTLDLIPLSRDFIAVYRRR